MVCFGYPCAFEDAAQRAVQAGLRILKGLTHVGGESQRLKDLALATWATVHTGSVVVGQCEGQSAGSR